MGASRGCRAVGEGAPSSIRRSLNTWFASISIRGGNHVGWDPKLEGRNGATNFLVARGRTRKQGELIVLSARS